MMSGGIGSWYHGDEVQDSGQHLPRMSILISYRDAEGEARAMGCCREAGDARDKG